MSGSGLDILRVAARKPRRALAALAAAAALAATVLPSAGGAEPGPGPVRLAQAAPKPDRNFATVAVSPSDMTLGRADAPVTIVEYASLTCPACADFHSRVLPEVRKAYVDTGKARLVYRDFPLDGLALAGSMLARCAGKDRFFGFIDLLFREQGRWAGAEDPTAQLARLALLGGIPRAKFDSCLEDETLQREVLEQRLAAREFEVTATPTLLINGRKFSGGLDFAQIRAVVESILSNE